MITAVPPGSPRDRRSGTLVDFTGVRFSGGQVTFAGAEFPHGAVSFDGAEFSGARQGEAPGPDGESLRLL